MTAYFISSTGNNSNDGLSLENAWLNWNKIESIPTGAHTVLITGDIVGVSIGRVPANCQLTISGATSTIGALQKITPTANFYGTYLTDNLSELTFADPFEWDCTNVTGAGIAISTQSANGNTLVLPDGFHFTNCSAIDRGVWIRSASGTCTNAVTIGAITCEAGQLPKRFIEVESLRDSSLIIDGVNVGDQTGITATDRAIVYISGTAAAGSTCEIRNVRGSVGITGTSVYGIWAFNTDRVLIEDCDITLQQDDVSGKCYPYIIDGPLGGADSIIQNNKLRLLSPRGYTCRIGNESISAACDGGIIFNNEVIGSEDGASNLHGFMISECDNGYIGFNKIRYTQYGCLIKESVGSVMARNDIDYLLEDAGGAGDGCLVKSSTDVSVLGNNITIRAGYECTALEALADAADTSLGAIFTGNYVDVKADADMATAVAKLVVIGSGTDASTATVIGNNYYFNGEAMPANMFTYGATTYATLALWNDAATVSHELSQELTATGYSAGSGGISIRVA